MYAGRRKNIIFLLLKKYYKLKTMTADQCRSQNYLFSEVGSIPCSNIFHNFNRLTADIKDNKIN